MIGTEGFSSKAGKLFEMFGVRPGENLAVDIPSAANGRSYITYAIRDAGGEVVYIGRASGSGTPRQVMQQRISKGHDHFLPGDSWEIIDVQGSKLASQGAEEFYIQGFIEMDTKLRNIDPALSYRTDRFLKSHCCPVKT